MADQEVRENPTPRAPPAATPAATDAATPAATDAAPPAATPAPPTATPAPPAAARPKRISHRGRTAGARVSSNQQEGKVEEFEPFMLMPRGPPPLKGEAEKMCTFDLFISCGRLIFLLLATITTYLQPCKMPIDPYSSF